MRNQFLRLEERGKIENLELLIWSPPNPGKEIILPENTWKMLNNDFHVTFPPSAGDKAIHKAVMRLHGTVPIWVEDETDLPNAYSLSNRWSQYINQDTASLKLIRINPESMYLPALVAIQREYMK